MSDSQATAQSALAKPVKRPGCKRLLIALSVAAYYLLGIPVWWYTTRVPRPHLPHSAMQSAYGAFGNRIMRFPVGVHVYVVGQDIIPDPIILAHDMQKAFEKLDLFEGAPRIPQVDVVIESPDGCQRNALNKVAPQGRSHTPTGYTLPCLDIAHHNTTSPMPSAPSALDSWLQELLSSKGASKPGQYVLFVLPGAPPAGAGAGRVVAGSHRHAWVYADATGGEEGKGSRCSTVDDCCATVGAAALVHMIMPKRGILETAKALPTSPAATTILKFTLANGAPTTDTGTHTDTDTQTRTDSVGGKETQTYHTWDFEALRRDYLQALVDALAPLLELRLESQVRLYLSPGVTPQWSDAHKVHGISADKMRSFVGSDWGLDFGIDAGSGGPSMTQPGALTDTCPSDDPLCSAAAAANSAHLPPHVLHVILYVPAASQRPLALLDSQGRPTETNSYIVPSWGAVHVLKGTEFDGPTQSEGAHVPGQGVPLSEDALHEFMQSAFSQLRVLLGLPAIPGEGSQAVSRYRVSFLPSASGVSTWEVDALGRARAATDIQEATRILDSFSRLVQKLPNLAMPDVIGTHVSASLSSFHSAIQSAFRGLHEETVRAARIAHAEAEAAFSHPAILPQLSFPESHKVGVYVPFFLPATLPIVVALVSELWRYTRRRREYSKAKEREARAAQGGDDFSEGLSLEERDKLVMARALAERQQKKASAASAASKSAAGSGAAQAETTDKPPEQSESKKSK